MTRRTRRLTGLLSSAVVCALALLSARADAHLLPAQQGTVNVVGAGVFVAVSVPVSALHGLDDNGDGVVDSRELERHADEVRAEIDARLVVLDGDAMAKTMRVDLLLSPQHGAPADESDQIMVLKHAELASPPTDLRVRCDLFGARAEERSITITATRQALTSAGGSPGSEGASVVVFTPADSEHALFAFAREPANLESTPASTEAPGPQSPPWSIVALAVAAVVAVVSLTRTRSSVRSRATGASF